MPVATATANPAQRIRSFLLGGHSDEEGGRSTSPWYAVMWLSGVDYFSTLGYQPSIAYLAAGVLSPVATLLLIAVTLFCALPVYSEVARNSYAGMGSIAMLERLLPGWRGKLFVLVLLGFATTDFVITMTLSAADAAQHAVENPTLALVLGGHQLAVTLVLLGLLAAVFLAGFREAIGVAVRVAVPYVILNVVVVLAAANEAFWHPEKVAAFHSALAMAGSWPQILIAAGLVFPKLALGMSGFETGVSVMPQIRNREDHGKNALPTIGAPAGRIRATRRLLGSSAAIMSVMLLGSSWVTTVLIPPEAFAPGGPADGRAMAFLAHSLLGDLFGGVYDFFSIAILWFAGASAMAGLLNLIPRYLPRFGMAPWWVERARPLVLAFLGIAVLVTLAFHANVDAQGGASATGVLVVMFSAAIAVTLLHWKGDRRKGWYFAAVSAVFAYVLVANVIERPDGVLIASIFILATLVLGGISRWRRSLELRVEKLSFFDGESERLFRSFAGKKVNMIPLEHVDSATRRAKALETRHYYNVEGPLAFLHVTLMDDRSEFEAKLRVAVRQIEADQYQIDVSGAAGIANTIAAISEELDPKSLFLGLTRRNAMTQALGYVLWGEGEVGILVYQILVRYWESTPEDDVRPLIFMFSD